MRKKMVINHKNNRIRKLCNKVYYFIIKVFPTLSEKFFIIDFVDPYQIRKIKNSIWNKNVFTDTVTLIFDDCVHIYLCLDIIKKNSYRYGKSFEDELIFVLLHSFLHSLNKDENEVSVIQHDLFRRFYEEVIKNE
ncbi:MAG: rRNA maturation RNAse YbeY [Candidatus Calescibacterium sp.]|nr:rRNA maturation RNAse YbeY [Candidatus Calescibacterium sp.]MDW8132521.1 rRNA maturation RNAse YbeY [Candidatus Calescibacterium sp.]